MFNAVPEVNIRYAIVKNFCGYDKMKYDFISTLSHEFAGAKEVIGYTDLKNALHFTSAEEATSVLESQPKWVREGHKVIPFELFCGECYIIVGGAA